MMIKHIAHAKPFAFKDDIHYEKGQVKSKTIAKNKTMSITLFAFDANESLSRHQSPGDALVTVLDGTVNIEIGTEHFKLSEGESIIMPANVAHAVFAITPFKMLLTIVFESV